MNSDINLKKFGHVLILIAVLLLITTVLIKVELDKQEEYMCILIEQAPDTTMADCPAHESSYSWLISISFGIVLALLIGGFYLAFPVKEKKKKKVDISKLSEEEKKVYNILAQNIDPVYQSDLVKETNYSKVKITRILDKLEQKKIVERRRRGMTNVVFLK